MDKLVRIAPGVRSRSLLEMEADRTQIAELYLERRTLNEIAKIVGLSKGTVVADLRRIREEWRRDRVDSFDDARIEELTRIDNLEKKYHAAYGKSMEGDEPDYEALRGIQWCIERRCKLLGLDSPTKSKVAIQEETVKGYIGINTDLV